MEVLVTGNARWLKNDFWKVLAEQNQVVVCASGTDAINVNRVSAYQFGIGHPELEQMFQACHFDCVLFFSWCFEQDGYDEIRNLDSVLAMCSKGQKTRMIYVCPSKQITACYGETHAILEKACDAMCSRFCAEGGSLLKLSVPYLVSATQNNGIFHSVYQSMEQEGKLKLPYRQDYSVDFLFGNDLASFLNVYLEEKECGYRSYRLWGGNDMTMSELAESIEKSAGKKEGEIERSFGELYRDRNEADDRLVLRHRYGWFPREKFENRIGDWYAEEQRNSRPKRRRLLERLNRENDTTLRGKLLQVTEVAVLFAVCEILTVKTRYRALVDFADFRLFFVAITGMMYGLKYGMMAAIASCIAYLVRLGGGINWQIQFYNIINWLPFSTYFLTGAIAGYTKERYEDMICNLQKSQETLEDKYRYLNQLYTKVLEKKERYENQIANYRHSYGRIYAVTKRLNSLHPWEIIYHAVSVLEEMMETRSAAVYLFDGGSFARLSACSRELADTLPKSIRLEDIPDCRRTLEQGETWVNRAFLAGQPDYAYGIYKEKELMGMLTIQKAHYGDMSLEYLNRFQIVSDLISDALLRAVRYRKETEKKRMLARTRIMNDETFRKEIAIQQLLKESCGAEYMLLQVFPEEKDAEAVNSLLLPLIRQKDMLGIGADEGFYILMTQADLESFGAICKRLGSAGVKVKLVDHIG